MKLLPFIILFSLLGACSTVSIPHSVLKQTLLVKNGQSFIPSGSQSGLFSSINLDQHNEWGDLINSAQQEQWQSCIEQAKTILNKHPNHETALAIMSLAYHSLSQNLKALYFTRKTLKLYPYNTVALNIKGLLTLKQSHSVNDFKKAASYFKKAITLSKYEIAAGLNLAYLYLELGNPELAKEGFEKMTERCKNCIAAQTGLGIALNRLDQPGHAREIFEDILLQDRNHFVALYQLTLIHLKNNEHQAAKTYLNRINLAQPTLSEGMKKRISSLMNSTVNIVN